jgi:hypothetical protein
MIISVRVGRLSLLHAELSPLYAFNGLLSSDRTKYFQGIDIILEAEVRSCPVPFSLISHALRLL